MRRFGASSLTTGDAIPILTMLQGLPGCGKTTEAKKRHSDESSIVRVNKDELREMLHNGLWAGDNEAQVLRIRDAIIVDALQHGQNVIVDDTNLHPKHEKRLRELAAKHGAAFVVKFLDVPVEECIKRDSQRPNPVGRKTIMRMYRQFLAKPIPKPEYDPELPDCVIVDVDGTLSSHEGIRGPFEHEKSAQDEPHADVIDLLRAYVFTKIDYGAENLDIIIVTGAEEKHRDIRVKWLRDHGVPFDVMYMRPNGDYRPDYVIKGEIYYAHIAGRYNVRFILDDRNQVVDMWRSHGLRVLQVADGDF